MLQYFSHFRYTFLLPHYHLFVIPCLILISCAKTANNGNSVPPHDSTSVTNIYIAGDNGTNPILWKNGIADTLSSTIGSASQVIVSGSDVYVSGFYQGIQDTNSSGNPTPPSMGQYTYWKNGIPNNIGGFGNITYLSFISVAGDDIYFANSSGWKNGSIIIQGMSIVQSCFASGNDIYFVGSDSVNDAVYWKNGNLNIVSPFRGRGFTTPHADRIYVSGNDVYVGGMYDRAVYWKNGVVHFLQPRTTDSSFVSTISSIFVSGNDVYTTGYIIPIFAPPGVNIGPAYWKNGIEHDLSVNAPFDFNTSYGTSSIFVIGSDVYVAGYSLTLVSPALPYAHSAIYWKNGAETVLSASGIANSIYVQ